MNPGGLAEEGGKVASGVVEALKREPVSLALVVLNVMFLGVGYLALSKVSDRSAAHEARTEALLERCFSAPTSDLSVPK